MLNNEKKIKRNQNKNSNKLSQYKKINENIMNNSFCYTNNNQNINDRQLMKIILDEYKQELKNMNECLKFNEENYEEELKHIKSQIAKFINENISLKTSNDKLILENNYKEKEIDKYKHIIQDYQKLLLNNNEKDNLFKNNKEEINNNNNNHNELLLESRIEKLKADNLLILNDLKKEQSEHNNTKISLNHYKENILLYENKINKKNAKIINLKKQIKELKNTLNNLTIKLNVQNVQNNDSSMISGSFSTPSKINFNLDNNNSNFLSNISVNSKNSNYNSINDNFLRQMNKLMGENNFLRKELQKTKNRLFDSNVQIQIYESQEEENVKIKQMLQNMQDYMNNIINQKIVLINFINKQINELNENNDLNNKDISLKFDIINNNSNYNNINNFSLNDVSIFLKYIFNKIISLCYTIDMNKEKEEYYIKELKDSEIEIKILQDQVYEKDCDIEAYKETIKIYENIIKKIKEEKKNLIKKINNKKNNYKNNFYENSYKYNTRNNYNNFFKKK